MGLEAELVNFRFIDTARGGGDQSRFMQRDDRNRVVWASVKAPGAGDACFILYVSLILEYLNGTGGAYGFTELVACAERFLNLSRELDDLHSDDLRPRNGFLDTRNGIHTGLHTTPP